MLPVFTVVPPIRPGQTLKSHLALVSHLNLASPRTISQRIFGAPWRDADWLVPGNLLLYAKSIGGPLGSPDPEYWLAHHTLVPLFAATLDEARVIQWKRRILGANFGPRRPYMTGSLEEWLVPQVKLCRACDDQNMERFGYSMVHREWMAPFATRCHHHHEALTVHSAWGPHARGAGSELPLMPARAAQGVLLAEKVEETLLVSQGLMQELLELLRQHDFLLPSGRFRRQALAALVQRACPSLCEHAELSAMFSDANSVERLLGPIGRDKGTLHTPVAVVLVEALRDASEQSPGRASAANTKKQPSSAKGLLAVNADSLQ